MSPITAHTPGAERAAAIILDVERSHTIQQGAHPLDARNLEKSIRSHGREIRRLDVGAVLPLGRYLADKRRPLKVRLYAAAFLGIHADPSALEPLKARVMDSTEDPGLRSAAINAIASLRLPKETLRAFLEGIVANADSKDTPCPETVLREALAQLAVFGAWNVPVLANAARRYGPNPRDMAGADARHAVEALTKSRNPQSSMALLDLLHFYRHESLLESAVLDALDKKRDGLAHLDAEQLDLLNDIMLKANGPNAAHAARLLGALRDPRSVEPLLYALKSSDPILVAEAAQALAALGAPDAAGPLRELADSLHADRRFAPSSSGPDTAALAARIQKAADALSPR